LDAVVIAYTGLFLGCLCRTILPYMRKVRENPALEFDLKYLVIFGVSVVVSFIAATTLFAAFVIPNTALPYVFAAAFVVGFGANDLIAEIVATKTPQG